MGKRKRPRRRGPFHRSERRAWFERLCPPEKKRALLIGLGIASSGPYLVLVWLSRPVEQQPAYPFLAALAAAFLFYALACMLMREHPEPSVLPWIVGFALVFRMILLFSEPLFEDDMYRYIWDGRMGWAGVNPYRYPPNSPALADYRDEHWAHINYPFISTIYPPVAQVAFMVAVALRLGSVKGMQIFFMLWDVASIFVLLDLLRRLGKNPEWVIVYAWSPLVVKEFANSAHVDSLMILLLLLAVRAAWLGQPWKSAAWFALSVLTKLSPLVLVLAFFRRLPRASLALFLGLLLAFYLPYCGAGSRLFAGLKAYLTLWEFNAGVYALFRWVLAGCGLEIETAKHWARGVLPWVVASYALYRAWRLRPDDFQAWLGACLATIAALVLLSPTIAAWYVSWLVPFLCLVWNRGLFLFTGLCLLSYHYFAVQADWGWIRTIEYGPVLGLLVYDTLARKHQPIRNP